MFYSKREFVSKEVTQIKPYINSTSNVWCERLQPGAAQNFTQCVLGEYRTANEKTKAVRKDQNSSNDGGVIK